METLNIIEKITLLISICIVGGANLFVLLIKTFEEKGFGQKIFTVKNAFFVFGLTLIMSSCSGSKFLNRKYTSGRFNKHLRTLKYNTVNVASTESYVSVSDQVKLKGAGEFSGNVLDKEILDAKVSSILKKDSIFIIKRKGKDSVYGKHCDTKPVIIILNNKTRVEKIIKGREANKYSLKRIQNRSVIALCFSLVPVIGFIIAVTNHNRIKRYKRLFPDVSLKETERLNRIAVLVSTAVLLATVASLAYLTWLALASGGAIISGSVSI